MPDTPTRRVVLDRSDDHVADVRHRERALDISRSLARIDMENLSQEFAESGGHSVWWGTLAGQAIGDFARAEDAMKVVEAEVGSELRRQHSLAGEKYTVDSIKDEVLLHPRVRHAKEVFAQTLERVEG